MSAGSKPHELSGSGRFIVPRAYMPNRCSCSPVSHRMSTIKTPTKLVKFCPVTRQGFTQNLETGVILDGVFTGDPRMYLDK